VTSGGRVSLFFALLKVPFLFPFTVIIISSSILVILVERTGAGWGVVDAKESCLAS
jgi:hypothetical protein